MDERTIEQAAYRGTLRALAVVCYLLAGITVPFGVIALVGANPLPLFASFVPVFAGLILQAVARSGADEDADAPDAADRARDLA